MIASQWRGAFFKAVQRYENASLLKEAALNERLSDWTKYLTDAAVMACESLGWKAAAKGHELDLLPIPHCEYLTLDLVAFGQGSGWRFPVAVAEFENDPHEERIAYSLWKVLCVKADLRIVFSYRRRSEDSPALIKYLGREVVKALPTNDRLELKGETLIVVGSRAESTAFPYGFFKWWRLDANTGSFNVM